MKIIGIVGGIGSGKSTVAAQLAERGAVVIDADAIGRQVLTEPSVSKQLAEHWGEAILTDEGAIDRARVAAKVFAPTPTGARELAFLEGVTHPRIEAVIAEKLKKLAQQESVPLVVLDAAVMFKSDWHKQCHEILFVEVPRSVRLQRALTRGWSAEHFTAREEAQLPVEEKRRRSDLVIDNAGTLATLAPQLDRFWSRWVEKV